jgi:hypothetical protein
MRGECNMLITVSDHALKKWATKKFIDKQTTMELMASVDNEQDLAAIAVVALLEVSTDNLYKGMKKTEADYIKSCHEYLRSEQITGRVM